MTTSGSHTFQELWELVEPVVEGEGLELYDIERASSGNAGGVIRVYLTRGALCKGSLIKDSSTEESGSVAEEVAEKVDESDADAQAGITVDDCALISRKLSAIDRFEEFLGDHSVLEVSSPGINRRLRIESHFKGSIGERISVKAYFDDLGKEKKVTGFLLECADEAIILKEPVGGEKRIIKLADISSAKIDFDFSTPNDLPKTQKASKRDGSKRRKKKKKK